MPSNCFTEYRHGSVYILWIIAVVR